MSPAYWTLAAAMIVGLSCRNLSLGLRQASRQVIAVTLMALLLALVLVHAWTSQVLRLWWGASGLILIIQSLRILRLVPGQDSPVLHLLENTGSLLALWWGSGNPVAVATGFIAGRLLSVAIVDAWRRAPVLAQLWAVGALGGAGLQHVVMAIFGPGWPDRTSVFFWVVPWLIVWEIWARAGAVFR